jgi:hypothetical protein
MLDQPNSVVHANQQNMENGELQWLMERMTTKTRRLPIKAICISLLFAIGASAQAGNTKWEIVLDRSLAEDEAVKVALADLELPI